VVRPHRGFSVSHHCEDELGYLCSMRNVESQRLLVGHTMMLCGRLDLAMMTAPMCLSIETKTQSSGAGWNARPT